MHDTAQALRIVIPTVSIFIFTLPPAGSLRYAMSLTDSEPNFRSRCLALGLDEALVTTLIDSGINTSGINTISKYAFSSSYVPGMTD